MLLLLIPVLAFCQNQITLSPYNLGDGWRARNDSMLAHMQVKFGNPLYGHVDLWFWDTYTYTCSDSSFAIYDMFSDSTIILKRFIEPSNFADATVETSWINFTKSSPLKMKGYKFNNWGPHGHVKALTSKDKLMAKDYFKTLKGHVDDLLAKHGDKAWKDKNNKVIAKKDKRKYAWLDVTGKESVKITGRNK